MRAVVLLPEGVLAVPNEMNEKLLRGVSPIVADCVEEVRPRLSWPKLQREPAASHHDLAIARAMSRALMD